MTDWQACGDTGLSLGADDKEWDGDKAAQAIYDWAGGDDDFDPDKVQKGFFAYDADEPQNETSYKLPFAYVDNGDLKAMPEGLHAVAAVLEGARGGVDLPDSVIDEVRDKVESYYEKMGEEVPW